MVTQADIARKVGIDTSSVNKILGRVPHVKFKRETVAEVFRVARELGYDVKRDSKHILREENAALRAAVLDLWEQYVANSAGLSRQLKQETTDTAARLVLQENKKKRKTG